MPSKVWQCKRLAVLHRSFRLPAPYRHCRQPDFCPSRWFIGEFIRHSKFFIVIILILAVYRHIGSYKSIGSSPRSTSWGSHVRPLMVRSRRQRWMGNLTTWCWIHIWSGNNCKNTINNILKYFQGHLRNFQSHKWPYPDITCPSAGHGGLQLVSRQKRGYYFFCTKLLLQMWQPGKIFHPKIYPRDLPFIFLGCHNGTGWPTTI